MEITLDYSFDPSPRYGHGRGPHGALCRLVEKRRATFERYLKDFAYFQEDFLKIPFGEDPEAPERPHWNNGFFPGLDAVSLHCMLCIQGPKHFCEIGSGYSTKFAHHAIGLHGLSTQIISIDPHPRVEIDAICDVVVRQSLEDLAPEYFDTLESGDILFIDSSHRSFMNSDVTAFYLDILPRLKSGVLIHLHDIFLPYDYPADWSDRFYNEQYLLACVLLTRDPCYDIQLANTFITYDPQLNSLVFPLFDHPALADAVQYGWATRIGWSWWMRKF